MRSKTLPPDTVRALGVELNDGRLIGWMERVGALLDTPPATVRGWATAPTSRASRPIPGAAASLLLLYAITQRRGVPPDRLAAEVNAELDRMEERRSAGVGV